MLSAPTCTNRSMGEIRSNVMLENTVDRGVFDRGQGQETDIRHTTVDGMVDTGAVSLILPQDIVERLAARGESRGSGLVPTRSHPVH